MRGWRWIALLGVVATIPAEAGAYRRSTVQGTDVCLFWDRRELPWTLGGGGSRRLTAGEVREALRDSFRAWEEVECTDLRFVEQEPSSEGRVGYTDETTDNLIVFRDRDCADVVGGRDPCWDDFSCGNAHDCWSFAEGVIAVTTTSYREDTGEIVDADIEFNEAAFRFTTGDGPPCRREGEDGCVSTDLANTATHEIGHMIGLDHSEVRTATMYASAELGETTKRTLSSDDVNAVCDIYPIGGEVNVCEEAYGRRLEEDPGGTCSHAGGAPALAGSLAVAAAWARRRRA